MLEEGGKKYCNDGGLFSLAFLFSDTHIFQLWRGLIWILSTSYSEESYAKALSQEVYLRWRTLTVQSSSLMGPLLKDIIGDIQGQITKKTLFYSSTSFIEIAYWTSRTSSAEVLRDKRLILSRSYIRDFRFFFNLIRRDVVRAKSVTCFWDPCLLYTPKQEEGLSQTESDSSNSPLKTWH